MNELKKENRPQIILEEIDFKKNVSDIHETDKQKNSKFKEFFDDFKKDVSFIGVVSITIFALLGNFSLYMLRKNPPAVTYVQKQVNNSEINEINTLAFNSSKELLNFDYQNSESKDLNKYFYKNGLNQWKDNLKQSGLYEKLLSYGVKTTTQIQDVKTISTSIVHGMVRNMVLITFTQTYDEESKQTIVDGKLMLTIIENPDQNDQFLISNTTLLLDNDHSITTQKR